MRILAIHNFHRNGSASGDDQVFKSETKLLEDHGNEVIRYTVCNDEFDNLGILGKVISVFGMLWSFKNYKAVQNLIKGESQISFTFIPFSLYSLLRFSMQQNDAK